MDFDLELVALPADPRASPEVAFTWPQYGALLKAGRTHPIQAEAFDADARIAEVALFAGGTLVGTDREPPYLFEWTEDRAAAYRLRLVATDDDGLAGTADTIISLVDNVPPVIDLTVPTGPVSVLPGASLEVRAEAFDEDGAITRVDFLLMPMARFGPGVRVASATAPPYTASLAELPAGQHMLYAVAVDDGGIEIQSTSVHLHVGH